MGTVATVTIGTDVFSVYALTVDPNTDCDSFWNVRLGAARIAWEAAVEDDQNRALVMASDWIDRASQFTGAKTVTTQAREWPRNNATCDGTAVADGTTPDALAYATFWLAGNILSDNELAFGSGTGSNVKSAKAGSAKVEFFSSTLDSGTRLPQTAHDYISCYFESTSIIGGTATGTGATSAFDCADFGRSEPLS